MSEVVFSRGGWLPSVVLEAGVLHLELGAGADALHQPRTFSFPITEAHAHVIQDDLARHLLLWVAILPLCDAAGTRGPLDADAATALLDPILLGSPDEVDALFGEIPARTSVLVGHGADVGLLDRGQLVDSLRRATVESDQRKTRAYEAERNRVRPDVEQESRWWRLGKRGERATRTPEVDDLSEAICLYLEHFPTANDAEFTAAVTSQALRDDVRSILEETARIEVDWADRTLAHVGYEVRVVVRRTHPELSDRAVQKLGNYYTYLVR